MANVGLSEDSNLAFSDCLFVDTDESLFIETNWGREAVSFLNDLDLIWESAWASFWDVGTAGDSAFFWRSAAS